MRGKLLHEAGACKTANEKANESKRSQIGSAFVADGEHAIAILEPAAEPAAENAGVGREIVESGDPGSVNRRNFRRHVVDEEAEDSSLSRDVKELRSNRHDEVLVRPDGVRNAGIVGVELVIVFGGDIGHVGEKENRGEHQHHDADEHVRDVERLAPGAAAGGIG